MRRLSFVPLALLAACATQGASSSRVPLQASADTGSAAAAAEGRAVIRIASVEIEREDPRSGPPRAVELAKAHGGHAQLVTGESATVRVPEERLDSFLAQVPTLGKVASQRISAEDVTEARRDLKVRLETLERARQRYLQLLEKAQSVAEAVMVEKELERVTAEHEALKARLEALQGAVSLATVELSFQRPVRPGPLGWVFYGLAQGLKWLFIWD